MEAGELAVDTTIKTNPNESENDEFHGYSDEQRKAIKEQFGIEARDGEVFITRSQVDSFLPTGNRSCCLLMPNHESFYTPEGFIYSIPVDKIPWVRDGDAATPTTIKLGIRPPDEAVSLEEYLKTSHKGQYSETVVDFGFGLSENLVAIYDFREIPPHPSEFLKFFNNDKYLNQSAEHIYAVQKQKEWEVAAKKLNVPFLKTLPDASIVNKIRSDDRKIQLELESTEVWNNRSVGIST